MCAELDQINLKFSSTSLWWLDVTLAIIMFGVALNLKVSDFQAILKAPKAPLLGLFSQLFLLPVLTLILVWVLKPCPSLALGMFLVASCPGGNISNFISLLARANVALSVSLSAVSTLLSVVFTPLNFTFWASMYGPTQEMLTRIELDPIAIFIKIFLILVLPLVSGMWTAHRYPAFALRIGKMLRIASIVIFAGYVVGALAMNFNVLVSYFQYIIPLVAVHNAVALIGGYMVGRIGGLEEASRRTLSIETGIQNSGVALVLIFGPIFNGLGGMAAVAALWGVWHILSGLTIATWWSRETPILSAETSA